MGTEFDPKLNEVIGAIPASATVAIKALAKKLQSEGKDVISMAIGEPDFDVPRNISEAAISALEKGGIGGYSDADGMPELKNAVIAKFERDNGITYLPEQIIATNGAKRALSAIFQAILSPGDEVIVPSPYWLSIPVQIRAAIPSRENAAVPVFAPGKSDFGLDVGAISRSISPRTRAIYINTPNNPSGAVFAEEDLVALAKLAVEKNILVISDEPYEFFVFGGKRHISIASLEEEAPGISAAR